MITKRRFYIAVRKIDKETESFDISTLSDSEEITIEKANTTDWNNPYPVIKIVKVRLQEME